MGVLAAKQSNFDGLTGPRKWAVKFLVGAFTLGDPALYEQPNGDVWYVFSDRGIDLRFVEKFFWMLVTVIPNVNDTPKRVGVDYQVQETVQVEVPVRVLVEYPVLDENGDPTGETVEILEDHPTETTTTDVVVSLGDPLQLAADAQGAPAWFTAREEIPDGLTPVGDGDE